MPSEAPPTRPLSWWKKTAFAAVAVVLFFAGLELLLALAGVSPIVADEDPFVGFSGTLPLFIEDGTSAEGRQMATAPNKRGLFNVQRFADPKPAGVYRIFCLGGSTTYGHPYDDRTSFAGWLRELLPCADPSGQRRWEVINAGGVSYASYRIASLVEELCRYEPDLFIVYTGHNEFLEERTYGSLRELPDELLRASGLLARTRTYGAIHRLMRRGKPATPRTLLPAEVDAVLDHSVGPSDYHRNELLSRQIVRHFDFNLRRLTLLARQAGAEVVFVTPGANLRDCSPFKSEHRDGLSVQDRHSWSEAFHEGLRLLRDGDAAAALVQFNTALALDPLHAEAHYRRGQCLIALDKHEEALQAMTRARDEDVCPLRATRPVIEAVRRVAADEDVPLVDFERWLAQECRRQFIHAIPGKEMFLDHVHPTIEINRALAEQIIEVLRSGGVVNADDAWSQRCGTAAQEKILGQLTPADHATAHRMVAKVFSWAGKIEEAGPAALAALQIAGDDRESLFIAGAYYRFLGRDSEARRAYRRALELELAEHPDDLEAREFLAETLLEQEQWDAARAEFEKVLSQREDVPAAHRDLAKALLKLGEADEARRHLRRAAQLAPDDAETAALLKQVGQENADHP